LNPYPLGTTSPRLYDGWRIRVNSASLNADSQVEAVVDPSTGLPANPPPPAGSQYALVNVTVTFLRRGSHRLDSYVANQMQAERPDGENLYGYRADVTCETPLLNLRSVPYIYSGQSLTGNICYEIASQDAGILEMTGGFTQWPNQLVWFALR
jgi:hypothetical protein